MGIVRTTRKAWRLAGSPLDAEDRRFFGGILVYVFIGGTGLIGGAAIIATAWRVFTAIAGG